VEHLFGADDAYAVRPCGPLQPERQDEAAATRDGKIAGLSGQLRREGCRVRPVAPDSLSKKQGTPVFAFRDDVDGDRT